MISRTCRCVVSVAALLAALVVSSALATVEETEAPPAGETPFPIRIRMLVTTGWLAEHLHDPNLVVLCIAESRNFCRGGHIPGARFIPLEEIAVTRNGISHELPDASVLKKVFERAGVANTSRIILYSERYGQLAARAYFTLDYLGLGDHAALLDGGLEKWKAERREISVDIPRVTPTTLQITLNPAVVVGTAEMRKFSDVRASHSLALLDARPADEYSGKGLSKDVTRAGHIPSATNVYWMDNLVSAENPVLKPPTELSAIYRWAGIGYGARVVTYCRTGMQSSFDYFVAKYLGYDVRMYDSSFYEWSRKNLPAEKSAVAAGK